MKKFLLDLLVRLAQQALIALGEYIVKPRPIDQPVDSTKVEIIPGSFVAQSVKLSLKERQKIFSLNICELVTWGNQLPGYDVVFSEVWRPDYTQKLMVQLGLSKTLQSLHQDRVAADLIVRINGVYQTGKEAYKPLAQKWKELHPNNIAGYDWGWDANHFEMR